MSAANIPFPKSSAPCVAVRARHGRFMANPLDFYVGNALIYYGEYSEAECRFLQSFLKPGDGVADVGANIGGLAVPLATRVGPSGYLLAVEPQPEIFEVLSTNLAINGLTHAEAVMCGASSKPGSFESMMPNYEVVGNYGSFSLVQDRQTERTRAMVTIDLKPLDSLYAPKGGQRLALLKADVEGMESDVLTGASKLIAQHRPAIYVENDQVERSPALLRQIFEMDYRAWWFTPPLYNSRNFFRNPVDLYSGIVAVNVLALPRERAGEMPFKSLTEVRDVNQHVKMPGGIHVSFDSALLDPL